MDNQALVRLEAPRRYKFSACPQWPGAGEPDAVKAACPVREGAVGFPCSQGAGRLLHKYLYRLRESEIRDKHYAASACAQLLLKKSGLELARRVSRKMSRSLC
jgi:hypothetical protein